MSGWVAPEVAIGGIIGRLVGSAESIGGSGSPAGAGDSATFGRSRSGPAGARPPASVTGGILVFASPSARGIDGADSRGLGRRWADRTFLRIAPNGPFWAPT